MDALKREDGESLNIVAENIESLRAIFPDAFTEDGINFETLRQLLGDQIAEQEEKFGLNWHGKRKARQIALAPSTGTLRPSPKESVNWGSTQNLFIEGDNLEVLKLLQKSYAGKIRAICIDPPYNTGNEFIYPDKYQDTLDTYLRLTGQRDKEGLKISSNTESSGRYHTNWLNMMYPRLKVARNLLSELGSIFITIDDSELSNVVTIMNEIFGEENFVSTISWHKRVSPANDAKYFSTDCDSIVVYAKNKELWRPNKLARTGSQLKYYKNPDDDERGNWNSATYTCNKSRQERPNLYYPIVNPNTGEEIWPKETAVWKYGPDVTSDLEKDRRLYWGADGNAKFPRVKLFLSEMEGVVPRSLWSGSDTGNTQMAATDLAQLFDGKKVFDTPKPPQLLKRIVELAVSNPNEIVLDFFAGSASMAQAVMERSQESAIPIRYIMVQLPEEIDEKHDAAKLGFENIADVGKERIRRAAKRIKDNFPEYTGDLGFKVFKLDSSNIRAWNPDASDLEKSLLDHAEHLVEGRSEQDVLYELLLKRGVDLTVPIEEKEIAGKTVYSIGFGVLFACLDTGIGKDEIESLAQGICAWHKELEPASDTQVVFRDSAFADDIAKTNMTAILEQNGIAHVRSL